MQQQDMFSNGPVWPHGLAFHAEFISPDEEVALLARFAELPFRAAKYRHYTARREVVLFGTEDFIGSGADAEKDFPRMAFPGFLHNLRGRVATKLGIEEQDLVHGLVTRYPVGAPIGWHRDAPPFDKIAGLSVGSDERMRFKPVRANNARPFYLPLPRRSLYLMRDNIRWDWLHSLAPVKQLRYSITFRTLLALTPEGTHRISTL